VFAADKRDEDVVCLYSLIEKNGWY